MLQIQELKIQGQNEECEQINLIIGPNNSGKTTFLNEIHGSLQAGFIADTNKWLDELKLHCENPKATIQDLVPAALESESFEMVKNLRQTGYSVFSPQISSGLDFWNANVFNESKQAQETEESFSITKERNQNSRWNFWRFIINSLLANEDCEQRLQGPFNTTINNLTEERQSNFLSYLFIVPDILKEIQSNIQGVFKMRIGFDDLQQGQKHLRILPSHKIKGPTNSPDTAEKWQKESQFVQQQGHGLRAYLRLVFTLLQSKKEIVLVDEPESFLHPPQRKALGNLIAKLASEGNKQVFIATHDPEFLRGVIAAGIKKIKIFYLRLGDNRFSYSVFAAKDIEKLSQQRSNLISERILNSFFYRKTILCEAEDDRLFYEHAASLYHWDLFQDVNFIGFNGKSDVIPIFERLGGLGINTVLIFDIDYLTGTERLPASITDQQLKSDFRNVRQSIKSLVDTNTFNTDEFKRHGVKYVNDNYPTLLSGVSNLLNKLKKVGIYVVPVGELESWVGVGHDGSRKLQRSLDIIQQTHKRKLAEFLKEVLS